MNRQLTVLAALAVAFAGAVAPANAAAKYKIRWLVGHRSLDYFEDAAKDFKTRVEAGSHGQIEVEIVPETSKESPAAEDIPGAVSSGKAQMGHSFTDVAAKLDPELMALSAPYVFRDYRHAEGVFEGLVGQQLLKDMERAHLVGLSFTYSGGADGVATTGKELRSPADLKGLKVACYGDAVDAAWLTALGATPVAIGHDQDRIAGMAREGQVDAAAITWRNFEVAGLDRGFTRFSMPGSTYLVSVTYVNDRFFASLPKEYQTLLISASRELGRVERGRTVELNENAKRAMQAKGVQPVFLTAAQRQAFAKALAPAYAAIEKVVGAGLLNQLRHAPDGPAFPPEPARTASR